MDKRNPYPSINHLQPFVQRELEERKARPPLTVVEPKEDDRSQEIRTAFTRMTAMVSSPSIGSIPSFSFLTLGLEGYNNTLDIFSLIEAGRNTIGYAYTTGGKKTLINANDAGKELSVSGKFPVPGITQITIDRRQASVPVKASIHWKCYNLAQLEYLRSFFLTPGLFITVDWGHRSNTTKLFPILDFSNKSEIINELSEYVSKGKESGAYEKYIEPSSGNYDFLTGIISNFTIEFDGHNGYNCVTELYSKGEALYGMSINTTITTVQTPNTKPSIKEYFDDDGLCKTDIINAIAGGQAVHITNPFFSLRFGVKDQEFVTWKFFLETMIPNMLHYMTVDPNVSKLLEYPTLRDEPYVGSHFLLRSIDPATMIIAGSTAVNEGGTIDEFEKVPFFDHTLKNSGKLSKGVWLNVEFVKEKFLSNQTFVDAMESILAKMNEASSEYWDLRLVWNEGISSFQVVDFKHDLSEIKNTKKFYTFNKGSKSELLRLEFTGNLSNEQRAQIYLSSFQQSTKSVNESTVSTPNNQLALFHRSLYIKDEIRNAIDKELNSNHTIALEIAPRDEHSPSKASINVMEHGNNGGFQVDSNNGPPSKSGQSIGDGTLLPLPVAGNRISDRFGERQVPTAGATGTPDRPHQGIDIAAGAGLPIRAPISGIITHHANSISFGNFVVIENPNDRRYTIRMGHMHHFNAEVSDGYVEAGTIIGYVGSTGHSTGPHVHLEVINHAGEHLDPEKFFDVTDLRGSKAEVSKKTKKNASESLTYLSTALGANTNPSGSWSTVGSSSGSLSFLANMVGVKKPKTPEELNQDHERKIEDDLKHKFGDTVVKYIAMHPSKMRALIIQHSYSEHSPSNFTYPMMTEYSVSLGMPGISGLFPGDAFHIDKLPSEYARVGVFQIHGLEENISSRGWTTEIKARFKIMLDRKVEGL